MDANGSSGPHGRNHEDVRDAEVGGGDEQILDTIAAVAAAAAVSHQAQEQGSPDDVLGISHGSHNDHLSVKREHGAEGRRGSDGHHLDEQTEEATHQAVAAAAAAAAQQAQQHQQQQEASGPSDSLRSSKSRASGSSPGGNQPKRRKINTCLQCKGRKVKCDKVHPVCGPCRKHGGDEAPCSWAEGDPNTSWVPEMPLPTAGNAGTGSSTWNAANAYAMAFNASTGPASNNTNNNEAQLAMVNKFFRSLTQPRGNEEDDVSFFSDAGGVLNNGNTTQQPDESLQEDGQGTEWPNSFQSASSATQGTYLTSMSNINNSLLSSYRFPFTGPATSEVVREAISLLPSDSIVDFLIGGASRAAVPLFLYSGFSSRLVELQMKRFRQQRANEEFSNVDVSFVALIFALLALSGSFVDGEDLISRQLVSKDEEIPSLLTFWHGISEALMGAADVCGTPRLNCLMALIAGRQHHENQGSVTRGASLRALSIRLAQTLGLHRLGSARDDEARWKAQKDRSAAATGPQRDGIALYGSDVADEVNLRNLVSSLGGDSFNDYEMPMGLPDRSHLVREVGRRVWHTLVYWEWFASSQTERIYHVTPGQFNTAVPLNVDDEDLPDGTEDDPYTLPAEKPPGQPTSVFAIPTLYNLALVGAKVCDSYANGHVPSYRQIMGFDADIERILDELPVYLRLDGKSEHLDFVKDQERRHPQLSRLRYVMLQSIYHRLLILHRGYLVRGHHDAQYAQSVTRCIEACRVILHCRERIAELSQSRVEQLWAFRYHVFNVAMVLCVHYLELSKKGFHDDEETRRVREDVDSALLIIEESKRGKRVASSDYSRQIIGRILQQANAQSGSSLGTGGPSSVESLFTNLGPSESSVGGGGGHDHHQHHAFGDAATGNTATTSSMSNDVAELDADLEELLNKLLNPTGPGAPSGNTAAAASGTSATSPTTPSSGGAPGAQYVTTPSSAKGVDVDAVWKMLDSYARPSMFL